MRIRCCEQKTRCSAAGSHTWCTPCGVRIRATHQLPKRRTRWRENPRLFIQPAYSSTESLVRKGLFERRSCLLSRRAQLGPTQGTVPRVSPRARRCRSGTKNASYERFSMLFEKRYADASAYSQVALFNYAIIIHSIVHNSTFWPQIARKVARRWANLHSRRREARQDLATSPHHEDPKPPMLMGQARKRDPTPYRAIAARNAAAAR